MNVILLSGGLGKRLWPLSNDTRSKQFIKIFRNENGEYESMLQRTYKKIKELNKNSTVTIATSKTQVPIINNQLGNEIGISVEPCHKDTFPAIVLATAYLYYIKKIDINETVVVCPIDSYTEDEYFLALHELCELAKRNEYNLSLMGIEPDSPSEKYGYIIPETQENVSKVKMFKEKPNLENAKKYIEKGALWNSGIFAFKLKYVLDIAHKLIDFKDYYDLFNKYDKLEKISFDYAVVEKEEKIQVMRFKKSWKDIGTWSTLTESMDEKLIGYVIENNECENTHIINELNIPILCMGLKNLIVAASTQGILVSDKEQSNYIKPFVEQISGQDMLEEKNMENYKVIDIQEESVTRLITLNQNNRIENHTDNFRNKIWTIINGTGRIIIDGIEQIVKTGDVIAIEVGSKYTIIAETDLKIIEVQLNKEIPLNDKYKF